MELFHEYKNKCINAFLILSERLMNGENMTVQEFENEYYRLANDKDKNTEIFYDNVVYNDKLIIFNMMNKDRVEICPITDCENTISITNIPLHTETNWLYSALNDEFTSLFFDEDKANYYKEMTGNYPLYYDCIDDNWRNYENITPEIKENFRLVLNAINSGKSISYFYSDKEYTGKPLKIEYDERKCTLYTIVQYNEKIYKELLSRISDIRIIDSENNETTDIREKMNDKKVKYPIKFIVTDKNKHNALERALLAFSVYDHTAEKIEDNALKFTVYYYTMDLDILVKEILSFGSDIQVVSPRLVINKIKSILEKV